MLRDFTGWVNENNLVLIIITLFILISIIKIEHPGVHNDQLMFVNAATFHPDNMFLWKSYHGIPLMIFPYIGALKSYIYMPIFYIFGVNIYSIRLPHIVISAVSLFLIYGFVKIMFNEKVALLATLLLAFDPSWIAYLRVDTGPNVLEIFFKVLVLFLFALYLKTKKLIFFLGIYPALALGIFNKINFIWFVVAFLISFLIFYGKEFYHNVSSSFYNSSKLYRKFLTFLLIIVPCYLLVRFFIKLSRETSLSYKQFGNEVSISNIFTNLPIFIKNFSDALSGNIFFNLLYGYDPSSFGVVFSLFLLLFFIFAFVFVFKERFFKSVTYFFMMIALILALEIMATKRAVSGWHIMAIYPIHTIIFAVVVASFYTNIKSSKRKIILFLVGAIVIYQILINFIYINQYSLPTKNIAYTSKVYDLIEYAKNEDKKFICLDVDICNQLISLTQQKNKYKEPFSFLDPQTYNYSFASIVGNFNSPNDFFYIAHADNNSHFPDFKQSFFKFLKINGINYLKIKEFKDGESVVFEVYKVGYF